MSKTAKMLLITKVGDVIVSQSEGRKGQNYKQIDLEETFAVNTMFGVIPMPADQRISRPNFVVWEKNIKNPSKSDPGYKSGVFNEAKPLDGGFLIGGLETRTVKPYKIPARGDQPERTVTTATVIVLGDSTNEEEYKAKTLKAFSNQGFILDNGGSTVEAQATPAKEIAE